MAPRGINPAAGRGGRDVCECLSSMTAAPGMEIWRFARLHSLPASTCPSLSPLCNIPRAITAMLTWRSDIGKVFSHFNCSAGGSPPLRWFSYLLFSLSQQFVATLTAPCSPATLFGASLGTEGSSWQGGVEKPHFHPIILFLSFPFLIPPLLTTVILKLPPLDSDAGGEAGGMIL